MKLQMSINNNKKSSTRKGVGAVTSNASSNTPMDGISFASKIMAVGRRRKKNDDDDDDDDSIQHSTRMNHHHHNDNEEEEEEEDGRTNIVETRHKKFVSTSSDKSLFPTTTMTTKKKKKMGKKERQQEVERIHIEDSTTISNTSTTTTNNNNNNMNPESKQLSSPSTLPTPKKIRSRQKNIRKDTRLDENKPSHLRWGTKDYRGRPLTSETQIQLQLPQSKNKQQQKQHVGLQRMDDAVRPMEKNDVEKELGHNEPIMGGLGIDNLLQDPIGQENESNGMNDMDQSHPRKSDSVKKTKLTKKNRVGKYKNLR
jgi:hypothetical protein